MADYDGDGFEDIVFISGGVFQAYRNKGVNTANVHQGFEHKPYLGWLEGEAGQSGPELTSYTADGNASSVIDVNGDGRTDLLLWVTAGYCSVPGFERVECQNEGYVWTATSSWRLYTSNGSSYSHAQELGSYTNMRAVDLNGDGYTDIMYQSGTTWFYRLSDGKTFLAPRSTWLTAAANLIGYTYFLDLNGDGRTDMLLPTSTNSWKVMLSRPTKTHEQVIFEQRGTRSFDNGATIQLADVNADGKLDLLTATNDAGWKIYLGDRPYVKEHVVRKITNGWGVSSLIEYQAISDQDVYFRQGSGHNLGSDYFSPRAGLYVVSKVSSEVNAGHYVSVNYQYGGLLWHKNGRGLLGFEVLRTTDNQTGVTTETVYHQHWPFTGIPKTTIQLLGDKVIAVAKNTVSSFHKEQPVRATAYGGEFAYISASEESSYQIGTGGQHYPLAKTVSSFSYDNYGNLTNSSITQSQMDDAAKKRVTSTTNVFNSSEIYRRYGRLTQSTVTKTLDGNSASSITRRSDFTYYTTDWLLQSEILSPEDNKTKITTQYGYDAAGNISSRQVTAASTATGTNSVTRSSTTTWDSRFRYVASSTDAAGNTSTFTYNGLAAGSVTGRISYIDSKDANNQTVRQYFDVTGRNHHSYSKGALAGDAGVNRYHYWELCSTVTCPVAGGYLQIRTVTDGQPTQRQFLDKYGREAGSSVTLLDGNQSVSRISYDNRGRPEYQYEPGINAASSHASRVYYDSLGRISSTTLASGGSSTLSYQGLTTVQTDPKGKTTTSVNNYLGQTAEVKDHLGNKLHYVYDAYGNLKTVTALSASGASSLRTTNYYDSYGRKTSMADQDKGSWSYSYNGFGELLSQTDAKSQTTTFEYDGAGRQVRRYDPSGTSCWEYGTAAASYHKGRLYRSSSYAGNVACNTGNAPLYRETYSYNSRGLQSSKLVQAAGSSFNISSSYDAQGRPDVLTYPSWSANPADDVKVKHIYQNGMLKQLKDNNSSKVWQDITAMNARGQASGITYGNGVTESRAFIAQSGYLDTLSVSKGGSTLHSLDYDYDTTGNVTKRAQGFGVGSNAGFTETFSYDDLHRVTSRTISNLAGSSGYNALPAAFKMAESYTYDHWGNISFKTSTGYYKYDGSKTNRLLGVWQHSNHTGTQYYGFGYDNNGNVSNDSKRSFTYTAFDKPSKVTQGSNYTDFAYGPNRELYRRTDVRSGQSTDTLYIGGVYESTTLPSGVTEHKFSVGNALITKRSNAVHDELYLHKDGQGSTISITGGNGAVLQQFIYDPWGRQYSVSTNSLFSTYSNPGTSHGYTGHKMVNDFEVIHMGGRTYNPHLGRFMQADPFVQAPKNLQNFNRYSYVLNNPMSYTDPSGYFSLRRHIRNHAGAFFGGPGVQPHPAKEELRSVLRMIGPGASSAVVAVGSYFCGPFYAACVGAGSYDVARAFGTSRTGALRVGIVSGVSAYLFAGDPSSMTSTQLAAQAMTSYIVAENAQLGQALSFVVANWGNGAGAIAQNAVGQYMQYKASAELGRFATKNGMTLQELNVLLALNSQLGLAVAGTTFDRDKSTIAGFLSRDKLPEWGVLWDINDVFLNAQGLLDAVSKSVVKSGYSGHLTGHSLGAARVNNLYRMGYISGATTLSLPGFAYPVAGSSSYCGNLDAICGGSLMTILRPGAVGVDSPSWWNLIGTNHTIRTVPGYYDNWGI